MLYCEWAEEFGKNRWMKSDGTSRTIYPLDYNWQRIYDDACKQADFYFSSRCVPDDIHAFTVEFLSLVPTAWMAYKTQLEFFSGNLAGDTIDPKEFHAGRYHKYRRDMSDVLNQTLGAKTDTETGGNTTITTGDTKNRELTYEQGVQALEPDNDNIGELGRDYASQIVDNVNKENVTETGDNNRTVNLGQQENEDSRLVHEEIEEENEVINYYDQLAFGRERMEKLGQLKPFYEYFQDLFLEIDAMVPWSQEPCGCKPPFWPEPGVYIV